jgi:hypothetical protein
MLITLPYAATNQTNLVKAADHPLLISPLGVEALFTLYNPNCWPSQQNPTTSSNRIKNLGTATSSLYFGAEPVGGVASLTNAPTFDNGKLLFNTGESDRLIQGGGSASDFSINNQAKLIIFWVKPTNLGAEVFNLGTRHIGSADSNFIFYIGSGVVNATWIWDGSSAYIFGAKNSPLVQNNQVLQIAYSFEPNGANSTWKYFVNGGQIGVDTYTGNNALKYNTNTPTFSIGVRNGGETAQGHFYQFAMENLTVSGNNAAERVLLDYQEMAGFYASL